VCVHCPVLLIFLIFAKFHDTILEKNKDKNGINIKIKNFKVIPPPIEFTF
jgi:hypothetical protein